MSDSTVLHDGDGLQITVVEEGDADRIEIRTEQLDLSSPDDVVVVLDGKGVDVECRDSHFAVARLPELESESPVELMIRVHEFFEGWVLG